MVGWVGRCLVFGYFSGLETRDVEDVSGVEGCCLTSDWWIGLMMGVKTTVRSSCPKSYGLLYKRTRGRRVVQGDG